MTIEQRLYLASTRATVARLLRDGYPTIMQIARELGFSRRTLQRRLGEAGMTYRQLIQACRLERACQLLVTSTLGIAEIATELGYSDPSSFSRFFLAMTGRSPRAHRNWKRSASAPGS